ncbi:MAG: 3-methyl-2-oxobutanoate hydroxymethyltransferase [Thermovibrio sp.]|nr:MAG: 3-methyl-2-oxobutanoate hydroxymethyltransferase [Thermovibrio sp.]
MDKKVTIKNLLRKKKERKKITMISTYDCLTAKFCDEVGIDCILVGDSLGMVFKGEDNTLGVTLEEIIYHTRAVKRGTRRAFVIADMPFGSYQISTEKAVENVFKVIKETNADAVKLEGGKEILPIVEKLASYGVAVVGHLGFTPQKVQIFGGAKVVGRKEEERKRLLNESKALEEAGAVMLVLEATPADIAKEITENLKIPVIGIGAGKYTDGQVLVFHDLVGLVEEVKPKFVKRYLNGAELFKKALKQYKEEVEKGIFPSEEYSYG